MTAFDAFSSVHAAAFFQQDNGSQRQREAACCSSQPCGNPGVTGFRNDSLGDDGSFAALFPTDAAFFMLYARCACGRLFIDFPNKRVRLRLQRFTADAFLPMLLGVVRPVEIVRVRLWNHCVFTAPIAADAALLMLHAVGFSSRCAVDLPFERVRSFVKAFAAVLLLAGMPVTGFIVLPALRGLRGPVGRQHKVARHRCGKIIRYAVQCPTVKQHAVLDRIRRPQEKLAVGYGGLCDRGAVRDR